MKYFTLLRVLIISVISALILSIVSFYGLRILNENSTSNRRKEFALNVAKDFETKNWIQAMEEFRAQHRGANINGGPVTGPSPTPPSEASSPTIARTQIWLIDEAGKVIASSEAPDFGMPWDEFDKPEVVHEMTFKYSLLSLSPDWTVLRLQTPQVTYLLIHSRVRRPLQNYLIEQLLFSFVLFVVSVFLALSLTFFYMKRKSHQAREVLSRMERGELSARFKIQRIDEIGSLMLDFNRMAAEIERLVHRVQETENARKDLLQELRHDLRTPLTSLNTSLETLQNHFEKIPPPERQKLFAIMRGEMSYFVQLLEDLFFIADLDEPRYKQITKKIDIDAILRAETSSRSAMPNAKCGWHYEGPAVQSMILGDSHLILRLIKNLLDNAQRFAKTKVHITLGLEDDFWVVHIDDDGVGIDPNDIETYGKRRGQRFVEPGETLHVSLGLGSVIAQSIVELHEGQLKIQNLKSLDQAHSGTRVTVSLRKA